MANKLKNLRLDRIDLVDKGASQDADGEGAHVMLFKRVEPVGKPHAMAVEGVSQDVPYASTFDEMLDDRLESEMYSDAKDELWDYIYALQNALSSTLEDAAVPDKAAAMRDSIMQFQAALQEAIPTWASGGAVYKMGRKVSAGRMARLRTMYQHLKAILEEGGEDMGKIDVSKLAPDVQAYIAGLEQHVATATGEREAFTKRIAALEGDVKKLSPGPTQEELMKNVPDEIKQQLEKAAKENDELKKTVADEKAARLKKQYEAEVKDSFAALALDPIKDGQVLKAIDEKLSKEESARIREILASTNALLEKSDLFGEIGAGGDAAVAGSAWVQIQKLAQEKVDNKVCATIEQGVDAVAKEKPELYEQYQAEQAE